MRLAICAGLWRRLELAPVWWAGVTRLADQWRARGHTVSIVVSGSEPEHQHLASMHGARWVEVPNQPLGRKMNATVEAAYRRFAQYVLILGSDNFVAPSVGQQYADAIAQGHPYVGLTGIYFYDLTTGRTCLYQAYPPGHRRHGESVGVGRLIHRRLLGDGRPWDDEVDRGLDYAMTRKLRLPRFHPVSVGPGAVVVDVKTGDNLWSFDRMAKHAGNYVNVDPPELANIPEWDAVRALRAKAAA